MFNRIDDFLIDRVWQPIADHLMARFTTCYSASAFLFTGFTLEHISYTVYEGGWNYLWLGVTLLWLLPVTLLAYRRADAPTKHAMPIERVTRFAARMADVVMVTPTSLIFTALFTWAGDKFSALDSLAWLLLLPAEGFLACRNNPPPVRHTAPQRLPGKIIIDWN